MFHITLEESLVFKYLYPDQEAGSLRNKSTKSQSSARS